MRRLLVFNHILFVSKNYR